MQESAFSKVELEAYDRYWDIIRKEMTYANEKAQIAEVKGLAVGEIIGIEKGKVEVTEKMIVKCHKKGMTIDEIAEFTDSTAEEILAVLCKHGLA